MLGSGIVKSTDPIWVSFKASCCFVTSYRMATTKKKKKEEERGSYLFT
jgi:hypothetical protein